MPKNLLIFAISALPLILIGGLVLILQINFAVIWWGFVGSVGFVIFYAVFASLIGSWIPAGIDGHDTSLSAAVRRGVHSLFPRAASLFLVTCATGFLSLIPLILVSFLASSDFDEKTLRLLGNGIDFLLGPIQLFPLAFWCVQMTENYKAFSLDRRGQDLIEVF